MSTADDELDLATISRALWRQRFTVLCTSIVCSLIAVFVALTATPYFRAETVVTEAKEGGIGGGSQLMSQLGGLASIAGVNLNTGASSSREMQAILTSRHLAEEFAKAQNLAAALVSREGKKPSLWIIVRQVREKIVTIREDKIKGVTTVAVEWTDPNVAARWANEFVSLANELIRARAIEEAKRNIAYLNEQIAHTSAIELQHVMYNLVENETKNLMLAQGRKEYAFTVIDQAVAPEMRATPKRTLIVVLGVLAGLLSGAVIVITRCAITKKWN